MKKELRKLTRIEVISEAKNVCLVLLGCVLLALADALFIVPAKIVCGGVDSVAIIVNHYLLPTLGFDTTDITIGALQAALWIIGFIFLGKKFSFNTLLGSIAFPLFYSLMLRFDLIHLIGFDKFYLNNLNPNGTIGLSALVLAGLFGGALSGIGIALAYLGDGSSGGFDVISFIIAKYSDMKQDISGFIMDSSVIIVGIICLQDWELGLVGILTALACAGMVQFFYVYSNSYVAVEIISTEYEKIQDFIHKRMGHGTTLMETTGGYSGEHRRMLKVIVFRMETSELKSFIASVDPKAFVSFSQVQSINGKGFEPFIISARGKKRILEKYESIKKKDKEHEAHHEEEKKNDTI